MIGAVGLVARSESTAGAIRIDPPPSAPASLSPVNLRRTLATASAGLVLIAVLAACGFNYPTDKINQITAGTNYRDGTVDVLNAAIVSKSDGRGTFIATFVNTSQTQQISRDLHGRQTAPRSTRSP